MRKLILQMQTSLDGYVSTGPNDEQAWVTWDLEGIYQHVLDLLDATDTILIGRKLAVDYIPFWLDTVTKPDDPMIEFAKRIVKAKKIVFTKTLDKSIWSNTELAKGNLTDEVQKLKSQSGKDIVVYGGSSFVSSLIREGLIDEFRFYINPVAIGKGVHIFDQINEFQQLKLKRSFTTDSGIILAVYVPLPKHK
jgi:dihydrofolate reductase